MDVGGVMTQARIPPISSTMGSLSYPPTIRESFPFLAGTYTYLIQPPGMIHARATAPVLLYAGEILKAPWGNWLT